MCSSKGNENNLNNLPWFPLFSTLHMLRLQVCVFHYDSAVMLEDPGNLPNFALFMSRYDFHCISNFNMHFVQDRKAVWFTFLSLPSLKLPDEKQKKYYTRDKTIIKGG